MNKFELTNFAVQFDAEFVFDRPIKLKATTVNVIEGDLLCSTQVFSIDGGKPAKKGWVSHHELFEGMTTLGPRVMTAVNVVGDNTIYMMDAVTGSLYNEKGKCMTSDNLRLLSLAKKDGLDKHLLSLTVER